MDQTVVTATTGRELGTRPSKRLRAEGRLPAVIYGLGKDPVNLTVEYNELRDALKTDAGMNTVIQLDVSGTPETAIVRQVQRDPIRRVVTHVDFLRIDPDKRIKVRIPIQAVGEATAVLSRGGLVEQSMFEIEVEVSPLNIPNEIEVDQSNLTLNNRITVGDLKLPEGVTTTAADNQAVISPIISRAARMAANAADEDAAGDDDASDDEE